MTGRLRVMLQEIAAAANVPGVAVAIARGSDSAVICAGVAAKSGHAIDEDSVFEIGSITKLWTATLIMQLVDEGVLALDDRVESVLQDFRLADPESTRTITVRHLLCHSGGFDGDVFSDTGEDEDSLARYVEGLARIGTFSPPGRIFSYCNAGIVVLGRILEVLRKMPFDEVLTRYLIEPLGLHSTFPDPHLVPEDRLVTGHGWPDGEATPIGALPRGLAPTGTRLSVNARDLLEFGRLHAREPSMVTKKRVLSSAALAQMQTPQDVLVPYLGPRWGASRGLGWSIDDVTGVRVLGHNGHTLGQVSALRVIPSHAVVIVVLTNGGDAYALIDQVIAMALSDTLDVTIEAPLLPSSQPAEIDTATYEGVYQGVAVRHAVTGTDGEALRMMTTYADPDGVFGAPVSVTELRHHRGHSFVSVELDCGYHPVYTFVMDADGLPRYLHNGRALPRVQATAHSDH